MDSPSESTVEESPLFKEWVGELSSISSPEEKIARGLHFMRTSISQEGSPHFREFWEARRLTLPFFKESLNPGARSKLWNEYVDLTVEARRLKEILEEESAFAVEQIDLAIQAIEDDSSHLEDLLKTAPDFPNIQAVWKVEYHQTQRELSVLNALASRLTSLRKEAIKTNMRLRFRLQFLKRLSESGDRIFPRRKELIERISSEFEKDVDQFISRHFKEQGVVGAPYFTIREEIKAFQGMAKALTLNSAVFTRTRLRLSECWDQLKALEKERKQEMFEKKKFSSEQRQAIQNKIEDLKGKSEGLSPQELSREAGFISSEMRRVSLQKEDVRHLREELFRLQEPHLAAERQKAKEVELAEREKQQHLKERIAQLIREGEKMDLESLSTQLKEIEERLARLEVSKIERQQIERTLRPLKDWIVDKKERSLLNLSEDEKKVLENLKLVLQQRKERRQEIKQQIEIHRKSLGSSNLDFEKAMHYQELLEQERDRLGRADLAIEEIEQKIAELETSHE